MVLVSFVFDANAATEIICVRHHFEEFVGVDDDDD
jgi:hypothetical protein